MKFSVVIPIYNEEENIIPLCRELIPVMEGLGEPFEVILVDDGSTDKSYQVELKIREKYPEVKIIKLWRNYGQTAAFRTGINRARGEIIITLDGDGQNDPRDIPRMLPLLRHYDLVCGWRRDRKDSFFRRFQSRFANRFRDLVLRDGIEDTGCSLKIFRKPSSEDFPPFRGLHRFLPVLLKNQGYRICQIPVNHRPRTGGETKYGIRNRMIESFLDLLAVKWMLKRRFDAQVERYDD